MKRENKVHLAKKGDEALRVSVCGIVLVDVTPDRDQVTCVLCRRRMLADADPSTRYVDSVFTEGERRRRALRTSPVMTRERWHRWKLGCDQKKTACGQCDLCRHYTAIEASEASSPWKRRHKVIEDRPRWRSVGEAIREYATVRLDGFPEKSASSAFEALFTLGGLVQEGESSGGTPATRSASDLVHVERALRDAFDEYTDRGMGRLECTRILLRGIVGKMQWARDGSKKVQRWVPEHPGAIGEDYAYREKEVRAIIRQGTKRVRTHLEGRGLLLVREAA